MSGSGWQPEPGWQRLSGSGPTTVGVWAAQEPGGEVVIKRLARPGAHEPEAALPLSDVNHWQRPAFVALSGVVSATDGLREPEVVRVDEDEDGITLVHRRIETVEPSGPWLASCLARFAGADVRGHPWLVREQLRTRLGLVARRGGWRALARTPMADVSHHLWERREVWLARCDALPQVAQHGDPSLANIPGRFGDGDGGLAIDWGQLGTGPVGADLGYLSLGTREELEPLIERYTLALPAGTATPDQVLTGARVTAVYTALTRLDWALLRVVDGEGALAGKFRHPSVAPYIRAMQRQVTQVEALLD